MIARRRRKSKPWPRVKKRRPSFDFRTGLGYHVSFHDFGSGGIKLHIFRTEAPWWDGDASIMLPSEQVTEFLNWAQLCCGLSANILPLEMLDCLKRSLQTGKLSRRTKRTFKKAVETLENLDDARTGRTQRALNRG